MMRATFLLSFLLLQAEIEDEQQYRERMQEIDHSFGEMRRQERVRGGPELEREAEKLSELFGKVETFWKGRGEQETASFARMAKDGAEKARQASSDNNDKGLEAAVDTIAASCEGCHEQPLDRYRFRSTE